MAKIAQNIENMPEELLKEKRWIPVTNDKKPRIKGWQERENQQGINDLKPPVAFVISAREAGEDDYLVFDFDHILDKDGNFVTERAEDVCEKLWEDLGETFVEYSQSGRGLHFFTKPTAGKFNRLRSILMTRLMRLMNEPN